LEKGLQEKKLGNLWCKGNKMFAIFTILAYRFKTPSSVCLLGFEFAAKTTW